MIIKAESHLYQEKYDVIIIGSGLGGLAAGSLLSRRNYKILVLERKRRVGGRFSTIKKDGFKIPTGAIIIPDSWAIKLFNEMGIDMSALRPLTRIFYKINGTDYEISPELGIPMVLNIIDRLERERAEKTGKNITAVNLKEILGGYLRGIRGVKDENIVTVRDWLLQFTENEKVHEVFDELCAALMMAHSWELPITKFFRFKEMKKFFMASQGNLSIARALARVIESSGVVWINSRVTKIELKEGWATGVVIERNRERMEISCRAIISDAGPRMTLQLAGPENFDQAYLKNLRIKIRPSPSILVLIASDKPLCLEGINDGLEIIMGSRRIRTVVPITNICPELAPPNQHLLYASVEPISCIHPVEIQCEINQIKRDLQELFPHFQKHGRILQIKLCSDLGNSPEGWTWLGYGMPIETSIPNLFNVGDACIAPGLIGTTGSVESGYRAAETVAKLLEGHE